jgi:hypothetical protein
VKRQILAILLLSCAVVVSQPFAQAQRKQDKAKPAAAPAIGQFGNVEAITAAQLKDYLYFVASDEMEGRDTPSRGLDLTAKFIALNLSRWGVKPAGTDGTYFQKFGLTSRRLAPEQTVASVGGQSFKIGEDFITPPLYYPGSANGQIVYVGHGFVIKAKNINAYEGVDVKDKIMLVADSYPRGVTFQDLRGKTGEENLRPDEYARAHGAKGIIIIPNSSTLTFWEQRYRASLNPTRPIPESPQQSNRIPTIVASEKMVNAILQGEKLDYETIKKQMSEGAVAGAFDLNKQAEFTVAAKVETLSTQNVAGVIEGADPQLKNEYVAIGAHYDHVGMRATGDGDRIFNGADDDGSGTVATLAIAEALAKGPRPKRSVIFVWHAGEEKGLWGSEYFTGSPPVPINQIVAQLNIDMIGRSKKEGDTKPLNVNLTGPNEIYVIGSKMMSTELGNVSEEVNNAFLKLTFNYKYDAPNDPERFFYRSDHYNYAKKGIPIIFYFSGTHEDYHRPSDHADKIDYQKMEKVTRTIFATMWKLVNAPARPKVDKQLPPALMGN